jgi:hypothetical protein
MNTRFRNVFVVATLAWLAGVQNLAFAQEVAVEVRILKVSDSVMERLYPNRCTSEQPPVCDECLVGQMCMWPGECNTAAVPGGPIFLTAAELRHFIETAQVDAGTNVMLAPRLRVESGRTGAVETTNQRFFVTKLAVVEVGGSAVCVPKNELVTTGLQMSVQPIVSADHRFVQLSFRAKLSQVDPFVPLLPFTTLITPAAEDGLAKPIPFTQYIQQPHVTTIRLDSKVTVADGCSVLLQGSGKSSRVTRHESTPETLSKIPYVNSLFKTVGYSRETENIFVLVTPRILAQQEKAKLPTSAVVETRAVAPPPPPPGPGLVGRPLNIELIQTGAMIPPPAPVPSPIPVRIIFDPAEKEKPTCCPGEGSACCEVSRHVELYCRACAEGRLADASQHAIQALAIDPTCFSKCPKACAAGK